MVTAVQHTNTRTVYFPILYNTIQRAAACTPLQYANQFSGSRLLVVRLLQWDRYLQGAAILKDTDSRSGDPDPELPAPDFRTLHAFSALFRLRISEPWDPDLCR